MSRRTEQRRAATWTLYQGDLLGRSPEQMLSGDAHHFTRVLAAEVHRHQSELDAIISRHANGWTLGRIAPLERSILRVALLEMTRPELLPGERRIAPE